MYIFLWMILTLSEYEKPQLKYLVQQRGFQQLHAIIVPIMYFVS